MAKVNVVEVVDLLEEEFRRALDATVREHFDHQDFNSRALFKTFKNQVSKKCKAWERIPNRHIRSE